MAGMLGGVTRLFGIWTGSKKGFGGVGCNSVVGMEGGREDVNAKGF